MKLKHEEEEKLTTGRGYFLLWACDAKIAQLGQKNDPTNSVEKISNTTMFYPVKIKLSKEEKKS